MCLHEMYPQVFFKQIALRALAEVIAREVRSILCEGITTHDYPSSNIELYYSLLVSISYKIALILFYLN